MSDRASAVLVASAWWSRKAASVPMTILTQLSLDRLGQLKAQVGMEFLTGSQAHIETMRWANA